MGNKTKAYTAKRFALLYAGSRTVQAEYRVEAQQPASNRLFLDIKTI
jgi:hypothetical protein